MRIMKRVFYDSRFDRIKLNIGSASKQIKVFFHKEAFKSVLPEVSDVTVFLFIIKSVGEVQFLHDLRQR